VHEHAAGYSDTKYVEGRGGGGCAWKTLSRRTSKMGHVDATCCYQIPKPGGPAYLFLSLEEGFIRRWCEDLARKAFWGK